MAGTLCINAAAASSQEAHVNFSLKQSSKEKSIQAAFYGDPNWETAHYGLAIFTKNNATPKILLICSDQDGMNNGCTGTVPYNKIPKFSETTKIVPYYQDADSKVPVLGQTNELKPFYDLTAVKISYQCSTLPHGLLMSVWKSIHPKWSKWLNEKNSSAQLTGLDMSKTYSFTGPQNILKFSPPATIQIVNAGLWRCKAVLPTNDTSCKTLANTQWEGSTETHTNMAGGVECNYNTTYNIGTQGKTINIDSSLNPQAKNSSYCPKTAQKAISTPHCSNDNISFNLQGDHPTHSPDRVTLHTSKDSMIGKGSFTDTSVIKTTVKYTISMSKK